MSKPPSFADSELVVIPPLAQHTCTVIWLHGLGDCGSSWCFLAETLGPQFPMIKWILPNAPVRSVTMNGFGDIPAWFDVFAVDKSSKVQRFDDTGMLASAARVDELIKAESKQGIDKIILGGFSQGCILSLLIGLTTQIKLSGIIGTSGYLPLGEKFTAMASGINQHTAILMCHGDQDLVVKYKYGQASSRYLASLGYRVDFKSYSGLGHVVCDQEIQDIAAFLNQCLISSSKL
ncbi:Phospholipase/carboxylesterase/thioesterase [Chlamydoabsidia padenii]|nr:Phospholipase/carboxylesterase/thioesterase [Chlamydoabsidia padenii]